MLNNDPNLHRLIKKHGVIDNNSFNLNFCMNLSVCLAHLQTIFGNDHMERFIKDQLSAGKQQYDEDTFFEAISEFSVLRFYAIRSKWKQALYEPPVQISKSLKNPEARFVGELSLNGNVEEIVINIEVKCPKFPSMSIKKAKLRYPRFYFPTRVENKSRDSAKRMKSSI